MLLIALQISEMNQSVPHSLRYLIVEADWLIQPDRNKVRLRFVASYCPQMRDSCAEAVYTIVLN